MKAVVYKEYGAPEVLKIQEVVKPTPKENEVLIKVKASTVTTGDTRFRKADPFAIRFFNGIIKPKKQILGMFFSGDIVAIGTKVTKFKIGDKIFGSTGMSIFNAWAEFICIKEDATITSMPVKITYEEVASVIFGASTALHFLKKANLKKGDNILVYAASGAVGSAVVQIAKYYGANVTGVCSSKNFKFVKSLGADKVIDYTTEDFTKNDVKYEIIYDSIGKISYKKCKNSLTHSGLFVSNNAGLGDYLNLIWTSFLGKRKIVTGVSSDNLEKLTQIKKLLETKKITVPIDKTYPLDQIIQANYHVDSGHKKGNIAISFH
ncbi:MAG: NAD(P)-dependent alcohol dehydrogenase [Lutibacter sp.]|uniref:NAD(P)-dependent alcohol dehydrogenase n=1 Tax=Lutibacter sp. TaxID=1925666 RepID=UPI00299E463B|nr:NAD(P)-dependent alcohol dehydrogenase [Lutibacter sp.]MDX1829821.1 NAD(P)-dependent alcohol dehydrogenase [Lutibacter sp.]